jgi:hypothetical protein
MEVLFSNFWELRIHILGRLTLEEKISEVTGKIDLF